MAKKRNTKIQTRSEFLHQVSVSSPRIMYFDALKIGARLLKLLSILGLFVALAYGCKLLWNHFVRNNAEFHLTQLELPEGCQISGIRVLEACEIEMNSSIFSIDTDALEQKLTAMPEVKSAEVFVRLPGTLKVDLIERVPVAWIECKSLGVIGRDAVRGLLVDQEKTLFSCDPAIFKRYEAFPIIKLPSLERKEIGPGMQLIHKEGLRAYSLLKTSNDLVNNGLVNLPPFESVQVRSENSLEVRCYDNSSIIFGLYEHERQLQDFVTILERAQETDRRLMNANLIPERNIPVQMVPINES